ncbi:uncharacterized protein LOC134265552 [Saccostrea cucullata]|uniref:uncharacterized protein LOC134265552 n=1 Tax=Saccostrea cuccullata TaxID=36930 RepID=UPI002ED4903B
MGRLSKWSAVEYRLLLYVVFFLVLIQDNIYSMPNQNWNWFEAQQHCINDNGTLKINPVMTSDNEYWTGVYRRYSAIIKILGCYSVDDLQQTKNLTFIMKYASAGFCQEICEAISPSNFGIKAMECVCFKETLTARTISSTQCNETCPKYTSDDFSFAECGGRNAYTLYSSDIQTRQGWIESMNLCESLLSPSYLVGNLSIYDANIACEQLKRTQNESSWIGVANEVYVGYDRGFPFNISESSFLQCRKCNMSNCEFTDCFERLYNFHCEKIKEIMLDETDIINRENEDPPFTVILLSVLVLVIVGCLVLVYTCWKIKKKKRENANKSKNDSPQKERYQDIDDEKIVNTTNKTEKYEGTYRETPNGTYDHLRTKDARKRISKNDYDHVNSSKEEEYEGCLMKGNNEHREADYDHPCISSDYGKCVITANPVDEEYAKLSSL